MLELLRPAILVFFLSICSYYDIFNKKNVPLWATGSMVAVGFLLNLATFDTALIVSSTAAATAILILGYLVYKSGQIGGADVLAFIGIALIVPFSAQYFHPLYAIAFDYPFVLSVFLLSGFLGIVGLCAYYAPKIAAKISRGEARLSTSWALLALATTALSIALIIFALGKGLLNSGQATALSALLLMTGFITLFRTQISESMVKWVKFDEIDEEDVLALDLLSPEIITKNGLQPVATTDQLDKLGKTGLKKFPVYKGMPAFMPYLLIASVIILLFGDPLLILL